MRIFFFFFGSLLVIISHCIAVFKTIIIDDYVVIKLKS